MPANFHQVPDALGKGVSRGTRGTRTRGSRAWVRRRRAEGAGPGATREPAGGRRSACGREAARSGRALREGVEAEGRDGLAAGGREARPARGWNYNRMDVRRTGLKQCTPRPPREQTARPSPRPATLRAALPAGDLDWGPGRGQLQPPGTGAGVGDRRSGTLNSGAASPSPGWTGRFHPA